MINGIKIKIIFLFFYCNLLYGNDTNPDLLFSKNIRSGKVRSLHAKEVHLTSTLKSGKAKTKIYELWRKTEINSNYSKTLSVFKSPKKIKGQGVLMIERGESSEGNDVKMYLPAYKKIRRIERSMQSGSFMGTAFYYSDLLTPEVKNYKHQFIKKDKCKIETKKNCYIVKSIPKNKKIRERKGYHSFLTWINEESFVSDYFEGYDQNGKKIKTLEFKNYEKQSDGKWVGKFIKAIDLKNKRWAVFEIKKYETEVDINDSLFSERTLKNP